MDDIALEDAREVLADLQARLLKAEKRYGMLCDVISSMKEPPSPDVLAEELGVTEEFAVAILTGRSLASAIALHEKSRKDKQRRKRRF